MQETQESEATAQDEKIVANRSNNIFTWLGFLKVDKQQGDIHWKTHRQIMTNDLWHLKLYHAADYVERSQTDSTQSPAGATPVCLQLLKLDQCVFVSWYVACM